MKVEGSKSYISEAGISQGHGVILWIMKLDYETTVLQYHGFLVSVLETHRSRAAGV